MSGHGEKLSRKQEQAVGGLVLAPTITEAARMTGVAESTLRRWLKDESFAEEYRIARRQSMAVALNHLSRACGEAVRTLEEVMSNTDAAPSSRVSAAKTVLDIAVRVCELEDLERRIAILESILDRDEGQPA